MGEGTVSVGPRLTVFPRKFQNLMLNFDSFNSKQGFNSEVTVSLRGHKKTLTGF